MGVITEVVETMRRVAVASVALGLAAEAEAEALCLIGMSAEALTEQAA